MSSQIGNWKHKRRTISNWGAPGHPGRKMQNETAEKVVPISIATTSSSVWSPYDLGPIPVSWSLGNKIEEGGAARLAGLWGIDFDSRCRKLKRIVYFLFNPESDPKSGWEASKGDPRGLHSFNTSGSKVISDIHNPFKFLILKVLPLESSWKLTEKIIILCVFSETDMEEKQH